MDLASFCITGLIITILIGESIQWVRSCRNSSFQIIFESVEVKNNKDLIEAKIDIGNNTNGETVLNTKFNILQTLDDLEISYALEMEQESENYTTVIPSQSYHLCNFFKNRSLNPFLKYVYEEILKNGNFMKSCPIQKGVYFFREYRINEEYFRNYIPEKKFLLKLNISKRNKANPIPVVDVILHIKIDKSKSYDSLKLFGMGK